MNMIRRIGYWLESRFCAPAYGGLVLAGISICFFGAAMNTMAGWLYAISGLSFALLGYTAFLSPKSLKGLQLQRKMIQPVTAGDDLTVELEILNQTKKPVSLLQIEDKLPFVLDKPQLHPIETISPKTTYSWVYYQPTERRGIYRWQNVELATAAPLGLFWSRRQRQLDAIAIVYPKVLPLKCCPLVDDMGKEDSSRGQPRGNPLQTASEGLTRSLRPYRIGDPLRLIHWRSSARYGDLRVRELEMLTSGQEIIIAIDNGEWEENNFEEAVIAAASMYFYAQKQLMQVQLWTASTGIISRKRDVLEALAAINPQDEVIKPQPTDKPLIWLTQNPTTFSSLPYSSRWMLWQNISSSQPQAVINRDVPGIVINSEQPLQALLQQPLN
ncbi:DUF58 domain-containing protein [Rivularia sp. PCC 7116]|uniref:DUF58 domain-containing protein n=1 Tax=Rivularia sp. PCC 7116 TaxID=373994 RepID=UPI0005C7A954|nr:DUF58 domain-containing protein [Rivularia sp. PCC 7116]